MSQTFLPRQDVALTDGASRATTPFYVFLQALEGKLLAAGVTQEEFDALVARVVALEQAGADPTAILQGLDSIRVFGSLESGLVRFLLVGDTSDPGVTFYYGTSPDGTKGWHRLYDSLEAGVGLEITDSGYLILGTKETPDDLPGTGNTGEAWRVVEPAGLYAWDGSAFTLDPAATGVVGFALEPLPDTGVGAALVKITRDGYGRVEGMEDAALDDLSDVDTTTVPPADGDTLAWDAGAAKWAPRAVAAGGVGEILVADGLSAPPVMLTNEAEDDFLYSDT